MRSLRPTDCLAASGLRLSHFWRTTAMAKTNENGEMCLGKGENGMFTRAWSITDAMPNLTVDERAAVDAFGVRWFDGYSMYADSPVYLNALPVMQKYAGGDL